MATVRNPAKGNAGLSHTAGQQEALGLAILPMAPPKSLPASHPTLKADILPRPPAAFQNTNNQLQHSSSTAQLQSSSDNNVSMSGNRHLWLLPLTLLQEQKAADLAHEDGGGPPAKQCRALLKYVLTGSSSTVCFNMQGQHSTCSKTLVCIWMYNRFAR